jgi:hypothetical protein
MKMLVRCGPLRLNGHRALHSEIQTRPLLVDDI